MNKWKTSFLLASSLAQKLKFRSHRLVLSDLRTVLLDQLHILHKRKDIDFSTFKINVLPVGRSVFVLAFLVAMEMNYSLGQRTSLSQGDVVWSGGQRGRHGGNILFIVGVDSSKPLRWWAVRTDPSSSLFQSVPDMMLSEDLLSYFQIMFSSFPK